MKIMHSPLRVLIALSILLIFACVTINIYFPAEKVESVAGEIVEDIRGPQDPEDKKSEEKEESFFGNPRVFVAGVDSAWAQDVTAVSNPTIRNLKAKMKERFALLKPWFDRGTINEGDDGYVDITQSGGLSLKEKNEIRNLVTAENGDRKALYQAVAAALNIDPGQVDRVAEIFAKEWQKSLQ
jgi:hypothetical protein